MTGIDTTPERLIALSENYWNLRRILNFRFGADSSDDTCPERFFTDSVIFGKSRVPPLDREHFDRLRADYYSERGWDRETGTPVRKQLERLGVTID